MNFFVRSGLAVLRTSLFHGFRFRSLIVAEQQDLVRTYVILYYNIES